MGLRITLFTLAMLAAAVWLFRYWRFQGKEKEGWVCLGWMLVAWITGVLLMSGLPFPMPYKPLFPSWGG